MATSKKKAAAKKPAGTAKMSGAVAAVKRHPVRASLGVAAAAVGVGALMLLKKKRAKAKGPLAK